jgi:hypothetical protein
MKNIYLIFPLAGIIFLSVSCNNGENHDQKSNSRKLTFQFEHFANDEELVFDEMNYINAAGNQYEVTEIQYFVSDLTLNNSKGEQFLIEKEKFAHYIDTNLPGTKTWEVADDIPAGDYKSITMTFGIKGEKNQPLMFTDPPESDMLWPINLGGEQGGYHYMKLNGFWMNQEDQREPFNFHLGVGQERDAENNITGFIQNWVEMELPASAFVLGSGDKKVITIRMNVEQWWENPNMYDHNIHGGKIMQNQNAMSMGAENARSVFKVSKIATPTEAL